MEEREERGIEKEETMKEECRRRVMKNQKVGKDR